MPRRVWGIAHLHRHLRRTAAVKGQAPAGQGLLQSHDVIGGLGEVSVDRVQLLNSRHQCRLVLPYQRSFADQRSPDAAADRCTQLTITEVEPCGRQVGLGSQTIGLGALEVGHGVVERLRADGVDFDQLFETLHLSVGAIDIGLDLGQCAFSSHQRRLERRRVDAEKATGPP